MVEEKKEKRQDSIKVLVLTLIAVSLITLAVICLAQFIRSLQPTVISSIIAECIGNKSTLYISSSCPHCESQLERFNGNQDYLKIIDCIQEPGYCLTENITSVPTWIINKTKHVGVLEIWQIRNLTGC